MKKRVRIILVLALAGGALVAWQYLSDRAGGNRLVFSGTVEAVEVTPSFQVTGRITALPFQEGGGVKEGQVLATLDDAELSAQLAQSMANLESARARHASARARAEYLEKAVEARIAQAQAAFDKAHAGLRPQEVERARQAVAEARARASQAEDESRRANDLFAAGAVSQSRRDAAAKALDAARAGLRSAEETLGQAEEGTRSEDLAGSRAALDAAVAERKDVERARLDASAALRAVELAEADVSLARTRLSRATLLSPLTGVVLTRSAEVGEQAVPGVPIAALADLSLVNVRVYVSEPLLGRVRLGMKAAVTTDSKGGKAFPGRVAFISDKAEFTPKTIETREERVKLVYRIKVEVPNPGGELKPGMPVDVDLEEAK